MQEMISFLSLQYILIGVAAGFVSGFFGIGGGTVVVPLMMFLATISNMLSALVSFR
ncbi:MAG: hypothetical protein ACTTJF_01940 [Campylobacter sp.]|uniref:hypothetical protein n=1 Tax=Campylobacter sp. TaxID=205 RepID=UPI003FA0E7D9